MLAPRRAPLLAVLALVASPTAARGDDAPGSPVAIAWVAPIPATCASLAIPGPGPLDPDYRWRLVLSFTSCMQDASIEAVTEPGELPDLVDDLTSALAPVLYVRLSALQRGAAPIQLEAAYQIGAAYLALVVRARAGLQPSGDAARDRAMREQLEPLIARALRTAWTAYWSIDRAATDDPGLASDPVAVYMIRDARAQLAWLPAPDDGSVQPPPIVSRDQPTPTRGE